MNIRGRLNYGNIKLYQNLRVDVNENSTNSLRFTCKVLFDLSGQKGSVKRTAIHIHVKELKISSHLTLLPDVIIIYIHVGPFSYGRWSSGKLMTTAGKVPHK